MTKMEKEIFEQPEVLSQIKDLNDVTLRNLVLDVKQRDVKLVCFAARGSSYNACVYASYLISKNIGVPTAFVSPSVITAYDGKLDLKDALVIGVSQSGKAADVMAVLDRAKENNALTVAITNDLTSPMAEKGDYHLYCGAGAEESVAATKSFSAQLYLLALLTAYWGDNQKLLGILSKIPAAIDEELKYLPGVIDRFAPRYKDMDSCFVLSRGLCISAAMEAAMKLQETNYVKASAYSVADFKHGPLAQLEEGSVVFLYAPVGPVFENCIEMLDKLEKSGAEVVLITDDAATAKDRELTVLVPHLGCDCAAEFTFAVFAQLFACKLASVKELDPDTPRNLNKVTVTK